MKISELPEETDASQAIVNVPIVVNIGGINVTKRIEATKLMDKALAPRIVEFSLDAENSYLIPAWQMVDKIAIVGHTGGFVSVGTGANEVDIAESVEMSDGSPCVLNVGILHPSKRIYFSGSITGSEKFWAYVWPALPSAVAYYDNIEGIGENLI